jgi:hypothetical protein
MKRSAFGALMTLIVAFVISVPLVNAQTHNMLSADVPFAFSVDGKPMPSGQYMVREADDHATIIETKDGNTRVMGLYSYAGENTKQACKLVFDKVGDEYFLREIWTSKTSQGLSLPKSKREKEVLSASRTLNGGGAETVIVAMR